MRGIRPGVVLAAAFAAGIVFGPPVLLAQPDYRVVHSFAGDDGDFPSSALIRASDGLFWGTTSSGGASDQGVVFRLDESGALFHVVHPLAGNDGKQPVAALVEPSPPDGHLYGTTCLGGMHDSGTVFRVDLVGDGFAVLRDFDGVADGGSPCEALTVGPDGRLYGSARNGGAHNQGTIFSLTTSGDDFKVIRDCDFTDCGAPISGVVAGPDGQLYGASYYNQVVPHGTVFRLGLDGQTFTPLGPDLENYSAPLFFGTDGLLYGAVSLNLFRMDTSGGNYLTRFAPEPSSVREGSDGRMYGTTVAGGQHYDGTIFRIDYDNDEFTTTLRDCAGDGAFPYAPPILGADGAFWGTASQGGDHNDGVVYRLILLPIYSIMPPTGPASGGFPLGAYVWNLRGGSRLQVGGLDAQDVVVDVNSRTITGTVPALAPGQLYDVAVHDPDGTFGTERRMFLADFLDVPASHPFHWSVEWLFRSGVTAGCGGGNFCPASEVTRAQMAVFLLKAMHGSRFVPPPCQGIFGDVACSPVPDFAADWIEELYNEGITGGCGFGNYCPSASIRRDQMAVLLLKAMRGSDYVPPACSGVFQDVPCAPVPAFAADWIEELWRSRITAGCSVSPFLYCPGAVVSRQQMSAFLVLAFSLNG